MNDVFSFNKFLIYDIFEKIAKYLSIQDTINILFVNKSAYNVYKFNKNYCNKILVDKITLYFSFKRVFDKIDSTKMLFRMYYYFKNHQDSCIADFLIYIIDNSIKDIDLFYFYALECSFKNNIGRDCEIKYIDYSNLYCIPFNNKEFISFDDMKYILCNADKDQMEIMLNLFNVQINLLSCIIKHILRSNVENSEEYIIMIIKYIFIKHCFGKFNEIDSSYINKILLNLITHKRDNILRYFLKKKRKYIIMGRGIDYQFLVNKCIELTDKINLDILMMENMYDNAQNILQKSFVIINTNEIINLCEMANFQYLKYLVKNYLGFAINTTIYIDSICIGLKSLIKNNMKSLVNIQLLSEYINQDKKEYINDHITRYYDEIKFDKSKRILIY